MQFGLNYFSSLLLTYLMKENVSLKVLLSPGFYRDGVMVPMDH